MYQLICAILLQALKDSKEEEFRKDVEDFLNSEWFVTLTEEIEINPVTIREKIDSGALQNVDIRSAYH